MPSSDATAPTESNATTPQRRAGDVAGAKPPQRSWRDLQPAARKNGVPEGLWIPCPVCGASLYRKSLEQNSHVCSECDHHFRIGATERVRQLCDPGSFEARWTDLAPIDSLGFVDRLPYAERIAREQKKTGRTDAILAGKGFIKGRSVVMAVMDNTFMMASMGSVVGETITRAIEYATRHRKPLIIVCAGGGARMQESTLAVSQMIKTSAALARFDDAGGLYVGVLTDPTTGGTAASFAMLGDVILAEPKALIGFTGARVIANTVRQELPEGFQRAEFLREKGFVDRVVHRHRLRSEISRLIDFAGG